MKLSVVFGSLFVMLAAPVLASSIEPDVPLAESGALRALARELQPSAAQARARADRPLARAAADVAASANRAAPSEEPTTVSIDCDDRACVISSGLAVQVIAAVPPRHANR